MCQDTLKLYSYFGIELVETLSQRQISLYEADLDDALIDLELHDVVDLVKTFSTLANKYQNDNKILLRSIPDLFSKEDF